MHDGPDIERAAREHDEPLVEREAPPLATRGADALPAGYEAARAAMVACPPMGARLTEGACVAQWRIANRPAPRRGRPLGTSHAQRVQRECLGCGVGELRFRMRRIEAMGDLDDSIGAERPTPHEGDVGHVDAAHVEPLPVDRDEALDVEEREDHDGKPPDLAPDVLAFVEELRADHEAFDHVVEVLVDACPGGPPMAATYARAAMLRRALGLGLPAIVTDLALPGLDVDRAAVYVNRGRGLILRALRARQLRLPVASEPRDAEELDANAPHLFALMTPGRADEGQARPGARGPRGEQRAPTLFGEGS